MVAKGDRAQLDQHLPPVPLQFQWGPFFPWQYGGCFTMGHAQAGLLVAARKKSDGQATSMRGGRGAARRANAANASAPGRGLGRGGGGGGDQGKQWLANKTRGGLGTQTGGRTQQDIHSRGRSVGRAGGCIQGIMGGGGGAGSSKRRRSLSAPSAAAAAAVRRGRARCSSRRLVLAVAQGIVLLALLDGGLHRGRVGKSRDRWTSESTPAAPTTFALKPCLHAPPHKRVASRAHPLPSPPHAADLGGGQAGDGHTQRRAGHVVHQSGHKLDRLGVATVLACKTQEGEGAGAVSGAPGVVWVGAARLIPAPLLLPPRHEARRALNTQLLSLRDAAAAAAAAVPAPTHRRCRGGGWGGSPCRAAPQS